ncbi:MAG: hypothetical protein ACTSQI_16475 [Candidatus Helarchaeota archaeon]
MSSAVVRSKTSQRAETFPTSVSYGVYILRVDDNPDKKKSSSYQKKLI